ncbi:MAG: L-serine ammonia-lyase, partial [Gammaproteobacteria bacterium]|nr:L-serine ammonia-lyase [Gammaproteobacteria bacterium]
MSLSIFEIFKIGIGPSSSHTIGPMRAARQFLLDCKIRKVFSTIQSVSVQLYGSLALTGKGHGTDTALLLGFSGFEPDKVDVQTIQRALATIRKQREINLLQEKTIPFDEALNVLFLSDQFLPEHPNGMRFTAMDANNEVLVQDTWFSIGGGFIAKDPKKGVTEESAKQSRIAYPFANAVELLQLCEKHGLSIPELVIKNELAWRDQQEVETEVLHIWQVMQDCVQSGFQQSGELPGGLRVKRRAPDMLKKLNQNKVIDGFQAMDWLTVYALAVNEENAAGGRVVTAPTNGAAGIIPSVLHYYRFHMANSDDQGVIRFLLTAGAIGMLYKMNASISGAEMGCQGEVGVACSMAAAGLVAALKGSNAQIENAAEIGMEHNLGLTCDPIGGLVQIPCIERNAMAAVKAVSAARMAMQGDGSHKVSLDQVIETMRQT